MDIDPNEGCSERLDCKQLLRVGDRVKVLAGKHAGKVGVVRTVGMCNNYDVEIPKMDRYCFFDGGEIELAPPLPDLRAKTIEAVARQALRVFCDFPATSHHLENAMRALERALHSK